MDKSKVEKLRELQELLASDIISQDEFDVMKQNILRDDKYEAVQQVVSVKPQVSEKNRNKKARVARNIVLVVLAFVVLGVAGTTVYFNTRPTDSTKAASSSSETTSKSTSSRSKDSSSSTSSHAQSSSDSESAASDSSQSTTDEQSSTGPMTQLDAIKLIGEAGIGTADAELMPTSNGKFVFRKTQSQGQVVEVEPNDINNWSEAYVTLKDQDAHIISDQHFNRN